MDLLRYERERRDVHQGRYRCELVGSRRGVARIPIDHWERRRKDVHPADDHADLLQLKRLFAELLLHAGNG